MVGFFIAVLSGLLMSVQGVFNTGVTKSSSLWVSSAFVQFSALLVCLIMWAMKDRTSFARLLSVKPPYLLLGGVIGAFITYTVIVSISRLGPANASMYIVIAQIIGAYLIQLFGLFGEEKMDFHWLKVVGMAIAFVGIVIFQRN